MTRSTLSRRNLLKNAAAGMAVAATHSLSGSPLKGGSAANQRSGIARVITTCQNGEGHRNVAKNRDAMLALFDRALKQKPDLVCFPETFTGGEAQDETGTQIAETVPGPTTTRLRGGRKRIAAMSSAPSGQHGRVNNGTPLWFWIGRARFWACTTKCIP